MQYPIVAQFLWHWKLPRSLSDPCFFVFLLLYIPLWLSVICLFSPVCYLHSFHLLLYPQFPHARVHIHPFTKKNQRTSIRDEKSHKQLRTIALTRVAACTVLSLCQKYRDGYYRPPPPSSCCLYASLTLPVSQCDGPVLAPVTGKEARMHSTWQLTLHTATAPQTPTCSPYPSTLSTHLEKNIKHTHTCTVQQLK